MKRFFIEDVKCDISASAMCGPMPCAVVAAVKYREDGGEPCWLYLNEFDSIPNFFEMDEDIFDKLIDEDSETISDTNNCLLAEFYGIPLGCGEYDFGSIEENKDNPAAALLRYIILLVRCGMDEVKALIAMAKGRYVDELKIPMCDLEEEYLEELDEEENEE